MNRLFTYILFSLSCMASHAQEAVINKIDGSIIDKLSLMEMHKTSHVTTTDGAEKVVVELRNGATYDCDVNDITNISLTSKDDMLTKGRFANMKRVKQFKSIQQLHEGDLVGIVDEADYSYNSFVSTAYAALDGTSTSPIMSNIPPETLQSLSTLLNTAFRANFYAMARNKGISTSYIRFHVTDIVYVSKDIDGTNVPLSARLIYPYCTMSSHPLTIDEIYVEQHTTLFEDNMEPSANFYPFSCSGVAIQGKMVVQPDLLGFGITNSRTQMFISRDINGAACANCIIAAKQYADLSRNGSQYVPATLSPSATIISAGSSQGASTALGFTYYMENRLSPELASALPKVKENRLCAGAYNPQQTFEEFVQCDSLSGFLVPVIVATAVTAHPDFMRDADGNLIMPYQLLNPVLKDMTWDDFEDDGIPTGMTIWQMLNSMCGNPTGFGRMLKKDFPYDANPEFASFRKMIADGMMKIDESGNYSLNYDDQRVKGLKQYFDANDLTSTELWVPNSDIQMLHSINDAIVPFINSRMFYDNMQPLMEQNGRWVSFYEYENPTNMNHVMICLIWMLAEATGISVETLFSIIASS